tara:strand:+ start:1929 stop:2237 length:309 start_codon:yes stop_codon:yes gene_type:complete
MINMTWRKIIKESRKDRNRNVFSQRTTEDVRRTKLVGGKDEDKFGRIKDIKEDSLDSDEYDELAEETREDLMDKVMDKIGSMSKEELIELLIDTKGELEMEI